MADAIRLNLGAGYNYKHGFINIDKDDKYKIDLKLDLEEAKLPYEDNSVEIIYASHVLEHIKNYIPLMKEIHRVLKNEGILYILVPEFPCESAVADPTHVRFFVPASFYLWTKTEQKDADTDNIRGHFEMLWCESLPRDKGIFDRGKLGRWFTELEVELMKVDRANERLNETK